jgi:hypothetical protein
VKNLLPSSYCGGIGTKDKKLTQFDLDVQRGITYKLIKQKRTKKGAHDYPRPLKTFGKVSKAFFRSKPGYCQKFGIYVMYT